MRQLILTMLLAAAVGCSSESGDTGGNAGSGGTGGSPVPAAFDETTSIPATAGAAAAMQASLVFGQVLSSALETIPPPEAVEIGLKDDFSEFCLAGGGADLQIPPGFPTSWPVGSEVKLTLTSCEGSVISPAAVNGTVTFTVVGPNAETPSVLDGTANIDLDIADGTMIDGDFAAGIAVSAGFQQNGRIVLFLGEQGDNDRLEITNGGQTLELGCFDIEVLVSRVDTQYVQPLGVANFGGQVYTINDYTTEPGLIALSGSGAPVEGQLTLHSGDLSAAGPERSGKCFGSVPDGNLSQVTATFFPSGCVRLDVVDGDGISLPLSSTTWDKLLDFDFTPSPGTCTDTTEAKAPAVPCPVGDDIVVEADAYVRGLTHADEMFGNASNLLIKGSPDVDFARKIYLSFNLADAPVMTDQTSVSLVVTLQRHVSEPQPTDLSGIIDPSQDWKLSGMDGIPEGMLTWNDAPRNDLGNGVAFLGQGNGPDNDVRKLVVGYDFDRTDLPEFPDPENTQYAFDVTDFIKWALGSNPDFSNSADSDDDGYATLLMALSSEGNADGSALLSKEAPMPEGFSCTGAPFLHFEP